MSGYATTSDLDSRISALVNGAPAAYDTLKEIADVLQGNVNSVGDIITALGAKADKATTLAGYGIADAYTKTAIDTKLSGYLPLTGGTLTGQLNLLNNNSLACQDSSGVNKSVLFLSGSNTLNIGYGTASAGYETRLSGNIIKFAYGTGRTEGVRLDAAGNVGIGTTSPSAKLHVDGDVLATGAITTNESIAINGIKLYRSQSGVLYIDGSLVVKGGVTMYGDESVTASTIMDAVGVDGITIVKRNGVLMLNPDVEIGGGLDETELYSYLTSNGYAKKSDIPTIPTSLKNPYSLTINNSGGTSQVSYDGSVTKSLTLTKSMVGLGNVENTALSTWAGTSKITTLGTVTSGTWNGSKIANGYLANSSITISGTSVPLGGNVTQSALRSALGLGSNAYTSTEYLPLTGGTLSGALTIGDVRLSNSSSGILGIDGVVDVKSIVRGKGHFKIYVEGSGTNFGYIRPEIYSTNRSVLHIGSNYGGSSALALGAESIDAINIYNGVVGIGGTVDGSTLYTQQKSGTALTVFGHEEVRGNILVTGGVTMYSARKLKNIQDERGLSLEELSTIKPIRFTWKDGRDDRIRIGGIAEDVMKVLPEVIYKTRENDTLTMDYGNAAFAISASLIKPVINHEERIRQLEEEVRILRQENEQLKLKTA